MPFKTQVAATLNLTCSPVDISVVLLLYGLHLGWSGRVLIHTSDGCGMVTWGKSYNNTLVNARLACTVITDRTSIRHLRHIGAPMCIDAKRMTTTKGVTASRSQVKLGAVAKRASHGKQLVAIKLSVGSKTYVRSERAVSSEVISPRQDLVPRNKTTTANSNSWPEDTLLPHHGSVAKNGACSND